ncbi:MAG: pilus assembly protein TadA [Candidatus Omnitrophota bacterium]|jgi:septum site-determining protein MinD|nr:MAG: pilus assembly protein TadA [Candidatus Omnitrophota bacterium]
MSKVIALFSTKGGVGKTLIAANLAVSLFKDYSKKVLLVDLDLHVVGDMARMLDVSPHRSIADIIVHIKKQPGDSVKKESYVSKTSIGVDFLPAVLKAQQSPHLDAQKLKDIFELYDKDYDFIIVDVGKSITDMLVSTLNQANLILLIVTPDILSIYQTKWTLDTLRSLHFPYKMIRLVLNRAESLASVSWQEVRINFPIDIIDQVPSDGRVVGNAVNRGVPVVIDNPKAKISASIRHLASLLVSRNDYFIERSEVSQMKVEEDMLEKPAQIWQAEGLTEALGKPETRDEDDEILKLKRRIHDRLIEELNLKRIDSKVFSDPKKARELRNKAEILVANLLVEEAGSFITSHDVRRKLTKEILDEALGLGPLEDLLADGAITDIMVNNKDEIYIEKNGKIELTTKKFISNEQVKTTIERIIAPLGRRIDESVPMVDARLPDGSRVNAIISPLSLTGPTLTIRKFRKERFTIDELIGIKTLSREMSDFIKACVLARKNIIVSGGTGSGKTTILNILSAFIPDYERIVTIEDAAELKLHQEHWVRLEARPPNIEGKGAVTIRDLFRNSLRMRPDRIIIGECRGLETMDMLQAMNTGHDGSMTTLHANSTHDVLVRLDSMILMSGVELPVRAIREMVASALHVIVHTARMSDGSRKIIEITEVAGMRDDIHVDLKDIFSFKQTGIDKEGNVLGDFQATGYIPSFIEEIKVKGIPLSEDMFKI